MRALRSSRFRVGWRAGHAYLYKRFYIGPLGAGKPRYSEVYLGRVDDTRARVAGQQELRLMAAALARKAAQGGGPRRRQ